MTEAEWLGSADPERMLAYLVGPDASQMHLPAGRRAGRLDRKLRLFGCAVALLAYGDAGGQTRQTIERQIIEAFYAAIERGGGHRLCEWGALDLAGSELRTALAGRRADAGLFAAVLRCVVGNPFRPVSVTQDCPACGGKGRVGPCGLTNYFRACLACGKPGDHAGTGRAPAPWLTPAVLSIARRAYDERDFAGLSVLADALEEAGCREEAVLRHLRGWERCPNCLPSESRAAGRRFIVEPDGHGPGHPKAYWGPCLRCGGSGWILGPYTCPHVRGCHVADLVLGKE